MSATIESLNDQIALMEKYAEMKLRIRDWHGVRDACVDIEILEATRAAVAISTIEQALER